MNVPTSAAENAEITHSVRKRVFFVWNYLEWGGAQVYLIAIMKNLGSDWQKTVVLPRESDPALIARIELTGTRCCFLQRHLTLSAETFRDRIVRRQRMIASELEVFRILRKQAVKTDVVHIDVGPWQSWILLAALALVARLNVFVTLHNEPVTLSSVRRWIWKARMKFLTRLPAFQIFVSNQHTKTNIKTLVDVKAWNEIPVTSTAVDPAEIDETLALKLSTEEIRSRHDLPISDFIVVCVGNFIDRKGRWVFLDAAQMLNREFPNIHWVWITPAGPAPDAISRLRGNSLGDRFRIILSSDIGSRVDMLSLVGSCDVFALPSYVEGLPIALLEAMALGVASVSTDVYGIPEAVFDGLTGLLIKAGDAQGLASAIARLHEDPEQRRLLGEKGREHVLRNFTETESARTAIDRYEECYSN